jgi:F-type H+-transporting ATPase subunit b
MNVALQLLAPRAEEEVFHAHSSWMPETHEIILGGLAFVVVAWMLWKFAVPQLKKGLQARSDRIGKELADAARARSEAETSAGQVKTSLANVQGEADRIVAEARKAAEAMKADQLARLDDEVAELRARAVSDIEGAKSRAISELQAEIATLAIGAAEAVVRKNLDPQTQTHLVEDFIAKVGARS